MQKDLILRYRNAQRRVIQTSISEKDLEVVCNQKRIQIFLANIAQRIPHGKRFWPTNNHS